MALSKKAFLARMAKGRAAAAKRRGGKKRSTSRTLAGMERTSLRSTARARFRMKDLRRKFESGTLSAAELAEYRRLGKKHGPLWLD